MMTKLELQIFIGKTIVESKMSTASKLQILKFVQHEADIHQLMCLVMDGKITQLDEQSKQIVEDRFNDQYIQEIRPKTKTYMSSVGMASYMIPWVIYRKIRASYDKCTKTCGTYEINTVRRQYCMAVCKVKKLKIMMSSTKDSKQKTKLQAQLAKAILNVKKYETHAKKRGTTPN